MENLLHKIRQCTVCSQHLPLGPNPVLAGNPKSRILIIGQAPGKKVHESSIPWDDPSGDQLRKWLNVSKETFYDATQIALMPMGFCYPGKGKSGDLPPRPECAPLWHEQLLQYMSNIKLTILIGQYAQYYYLKDQAKNNLTETVINFKDYLPNFIPLPHPSPRNRFWLAKNSWFSQELLPILQEKVNFILKK
ncbi:MAG: uracil-DNA glycosylase family protein [Saprospiraceae bacterium]|nr:uracil-DNA glycosylase family protein [Saprospiraceae bacterium]